MKRTLSIVSALALILLTACDKETRSDSPDTNVPITFQVAGEASGTRGTPINPGSGSDKSMDVGSTFDVRCHEGTSATASFSDYAEVKSASSAEFNTTRNWPNNTVDLKFFAVHPRQTTITSTNTEMTVTGFTINGTFANQEDLLYTYKMQSSSSKTPVTLRFKHALTRVTFQMQLTGTNAAFTNVYVSKIELQNTFTKGTVVTTNTPTVKSWAGSVRATVSTGTVAAASAQRLDGKSASAGDTSADTYAGATHGYWNVFASTNKNNSFLMIPMTVAELNNATTPVKIAVTLMVNGAERGPYIVSGLGDKGAWTDGTHINYQLKFDVAKEGMTLGGITVASWGTTTDYPVDLN